MSPKELFRMTLPALLPIALTGTFFTVRNYNGKLQRQRDYEERMEEMSIEFKRMDALEEKWERDSNKRQNNPE